MRKTIDVEYLKNYINEKLTVETITQEQKVTLCMLLERILMETKNYKGYGYADNSKHFSIVDGKTIWKEYHDTHEYDRRYF